MQNRRVRTYATGIELASKIETLAFLLANLSSNGRELEDEVGGGSLAFPTRDLEQLELERQLYSFLGEAPDRERQRALARYCVEIVAVEGLLELAKVIGPWLVGQASGLFLLLELERKSVCVRVS